MPFDPFLYGLGISESQIHELPLPFPSIFNPNTKYLWDKLVQSDQYRSGPPADLWRKALREFVEICQRNNRFPFLNATEQSRNDAITERLRYERKTVVKFFNRIRIFDQVRIRKVRRQYLFKSYGFKIRMIADVEIQDRNFDKWLLKMPLPRFKVANVNSWSYDKQLNKNVLISARFINGKRWTLSYEITVPLQPAVPGNKTPSLQELTSFVDRVLWTPAFKYHRPDNIWNRIL